MQLGLNFITLKLVNPKFLPIFHDVVQIFGDTKVFIILAGIFLNQLQDDDENHIRLDEQKEERGFATTKDAISSGHMSF